MPESLAIPLFMMGGQYILGSSAAKRRESAQRQAQEQSYRMWQEQLGWEQERFETQQQLLISQQEKYAREQRQAQERAYQQWLQTAFPSEEAVGAVRRGGAGRLTLAREQAEARIAPALAARGFGPGTGLMGEAYGEVESGYLQSLGQFESDITRWAETPGMPMPSGAIPSAVGPAGVLPPMTSQMPSAVFPTGQYYDPTEGLQMGLGVMTAMQMYSQMYGGGGFNPYTDYGNMNQGYGGQSGPGYPYNISTPYTGYKSGPGF